MRLLLTNPKSCFGIVVFGGIVLAALLAPVIAQNPPDEIVALPGLSPSRDYWFGTTDTSLSGRASPRATEPNKARLFTPCELISA